jgi:hypothetical protein
LETNPSADICAGSPIFFLTLAPALRTSMSIEERDELLSVEIGSVHADEGKVFELCFCDEVVHLSAHHGERVGVESVRDKNTVVVRTINLLVAGRAPKEITK